MLLFFSNNICSLSYICFFKDFIWQYSEGNLVIGDFNFFLRILWGAFYQIWSEDDLDYFRKIFFFLLKIYHYYNTKKQLLLNQIVNIFFFFFCGEKGNILLFFSNNISYFSYIYFFFHGFHLEIFRWEFNSWGF